MPSTRTRACAKWPRNIPTWRSSRAARRPDFTRAIAENLALWQEFLPKCLEALRGRLSSSRNRVRHGARRKLLPADAGRGRRLALEVRSRPAERRRDVRLHRRECGPVHHSQDRRCVHVRHDRPGHHPLPCREAARGHDSLCRRRASERAFSSPLRNGPPLGLRQSRLSPRELWDDSGRGQAAL